MALQIGTQLGSHQITALLGRGGMGEVYRARDLKLKREVAIKILPEEFSRDADRVSRFQREAEVLASLNHPNIAAIYNVEEANATRFLVLELVEGETLAERLRRGPIPVEEALDIAKRVCEALEEAHEKGVIHRDLKPANVKITPDGKVKVLDFGLAKAMEPSPSGRGQGEGFSNSPTLSMAATNAGVILGTAAYMSPEQAKGLQTDARSDVFSFGCVLYEMLTGRQAFQGETISEILASVLVREPDFALLPPDLNQRLYDLLRRCLEKNPKRRWYAAGDLRMEVEKVASDPRHKPEMAPEASIVPLAPTRKLRVALIAVLLLAAGALFAVLIQSYQSPRESPAVRFLIPSPDKTTFDSGLAFTGVVTSLNGGSISPDGRKIALTARDEAGRVMLWVRALDAITAQPLLGTENAGLPFWSPDSRSIGFFTPGKLRKIDVEAGPAQTICDAPNGRGGTWNREGVIVFAPNNPSTSLLRVSASGGEPSPVTKLQSGETNHLLPSFLPDGNHFLYWAIGTGENSRLVFAGSLDSLEARRLLPTDSAASYAPSGSLLFVRQGTLLAQPFDTTKLELTGEAVPITEQVAFDGNGRSFSVSENGTLEYRVGAGAPQYPLVWVDRNGKAIESIGASALYQSPAISPDGKRIAVDRHDGNGGDIWLVEASGGKTSRLTFDASQENSQPIWSADGSRIVFGSRRNSKWGIYQKLSNGTGNEELLFESDVRNFSIWKG